MASLSLLEGLKRGLVANVAGYVSGRSNWTDEKGITHFYLKVGTLGTSLSLPFDSEQQLALAPPNGSELRITCPITRERDSYAASVRSTNMLFSVPSSPDWAGPVTEQELLDGARFGGICKVINKEMYLDKRDGVQKQNCTIAALGDTFSLREISKDIYDSFIDGQVFQLAGRLENDLRWQNQKVAAKLLIIVEQTKLIKLGTATPPPSRDKSAA